MANQALPRLRIWIGCLLWRLGKFWSAWSWCILNSWHVCLMICDDLCISSLSLSLLSITASFHDWRCSVPRNSLHALFRIWDASRRWTKLIAGHKWCSTFQNKNSKSAIKFSSPTAAKNVLAWKLSPWNLTGNGVENETENDMQLLRALMPPRHAHEKVQQQNQRIQKSQVRSCSKLSYYKLLTSYKFTPKKHSASAGSTEILTHMEKSHKSHQIKSPKIIIFHIYFT